MHAEDRLTKACAATQMCAGAAHCMLSEGASGGGVMHKEVKRDAQKH